jgi:hypothetical protein
MREQLRMRRLLREAQGKRRRVDLGHIDGPVLGRPAGGRGLLIWRRPAAAATSGAGTGPAEMTLAERYARGEIDTEEYRRRQAVLRERHDQGPGD